MAGKTQVDMRVAEGLLKLLTGGHTPTAKKIFRRASYAFVARERENLRQAAPVDTGKLKKAVKARSTRSGGGAVFVDKRRAPHFYFREAGTKLRKNKKGANRGSVDARPWIEPWRQKAKAKVQSELVVPLLDELKAKVSTNMEAK